MISHRRDRHRQEASSRVEVITKATGDSAPLIAIAEAPTGRKPINRHRSSRVEVITKTTVDSAPLAAMKRPTMTSTI